MDTPDHHSASDQDQQTAVENCDNCQHDISGSEAKFCPKCGYPARGTSAEQDNFRRALKLKKDVVDDAKKKIKRVKVMLYILGGLNVLVGLIIALADAIPDAVFVGIGSIIVGGVMFACSAWVEKNPVTGILVAFSVYMLLIIANAILEPASIYRGIIFKIIIIGVFIKGIKSAYDYREYTKKLEEHAA